MGSFARNQDQMRHYMRDALDGLMPFQQFEEMGKQNMALFENAMKMFTPFYGGEENEASNKAGPKPQAQAKPDAAEEKLHELREQLEFMQNQLNQLKSNGKS